MAKSLLIQNSDDSFRVNVRTNIVTYNPASQFTATEFEGLSDAEIAAGFNFRQGYLYDGKTFVDYATTKGYKLTLADEVSGAATVLVAFP